MAFALQADGWYLRQDIIWAKPNPMPESVTDRCTKSHEYLFLLSKSARYYYDAEAISEPSVYPDDDRKARSAPEQKRMPTGDVAGIRPGSATYATRNRRSVWTVPTAPYREAHFATFPPALIRPCILAGCPSKVCAVCGKPWERVTEKEPGGRAKTINPSRLAIGHTCTPRGRSSHQPGWRALDADTSRTIGHRPTCSCNGATKPGTVLDPFGGSGTTGEVAASNGRDCILVELNPEYAKLAQDRCGLFCSPNKRVRAAQ